MNEILAQMKECAENHYECAKKWKETHEGGKVVAILPMHFPAEIFHAAGAYPILLQEGFDAITLGHAYMFPYYCGFTRSVADQAAKGELGFVDMFVCGSGASSVQGLCVQDVLMAIYPKKVESKELIAFMDDPWTKESVTDTYARLRKSAEELTGTAITDEALRNSIALYNKGRKLMRELYDMRRKGNALLTPMQMQDVIKSSMVMDKAEHNALLEELVKYVRENAVAPKEDAIPVFLSGHLCQAAKHDILRLVAEAGGVVADDDLFHGWRYIVQDVREDGDPIEALAQAYLDKNRACPCPTRVDPKTNWELMLLDAVKACNAKGLIILQAKYCEPHMFYYAEIKEAFEAAGIPHLLLETEHEVISMEGMRTRIESFIESIR